MSSKAIAYFKNGIGNFVMFMPAIEATYQLTGKKVDLCLDSNWKEPRSAAVRDIAQAWQTIGEVIEYPNQHLQEDKYSIWLHTRHNDGSQAEKIFAKHAKALGTERAKPKWSLDGQHETDFYMSFIYNLGYKGEIPKVEFPTKDILALETVQRPLIVLCNGAHTNEPWKKKKWSRFPAFAEKCKQMFNATIAGVGVAGELPKVPLDIKIYEDILSAAMLIKHADVFVTTDTANMHIGNLLNVNMIALFGPTFISKNGPRSKNSVVIERQVDCAPCQGTRTRFMSCTNNRCMSEITVDQVINLAKGILDDNSI